MARAEGPCEVRYAWKFNDLKPRVYYAQGATAYYPARYIRDIANSLAEVIPTTSVRTRFTTSRLSPVDATQYLLLYDYSSFTSELTEIRYFLEALADFAKDTEVDVLDTHRGIVRCNLGDMISEYNQICNFDHPMDLGRIFEMSSSFVLPHTNAGLLGVYGNIVFSTSLHGLHLCQVCGSDQMCNCVGDDACAKGDLRELEDAITQISSFGSIHPDKFKIWREDSADVGENGWQFLKRPIDRLEGHIFVGNLVDLPNLFYICEITDGIHTVPEKEQGSGKRAFLSQTRSMLWSMHSMFPTLEDEEIRFALEYLRLGYRSFGFPFEGRLPGHSYRGVEDQAIPRLEVESIENDWLDWLWDNAEQRIGRLPMLLGCEDLLGNLESDGEFYSTSSRLLSLVEDLEYLERKPMWEDVVICQEYKDRFYKLVRGTADVVYRYRWVKPPPIWWESAVRTCVT